MTYRIAQSVAAVLLTASFAAPAFADSSIYSNLRSAGVQTQGLSVSLDNGVATIAGNTNGNLQRFRAEQAVRDTAGVDRVINLISYD